MKEKQEKIKVKLDDNFLKSRGYEIWQNAKSGRDLFEERMVKDLDLYHSRFSEKERKYSEFLGAERLFIPKTYTSTQRILVDEMEAFFPDPEELCDIASYKNIPYESKMIVKSLMNYRLGGHGINFYQELYEFALDATRNMIGVFKVYPRIKTTMVPVMVQVQDQITGEVFELPSPDGATEEVIERWAPRIEAIPPEDVFFSRSATWKNYWRYAICHRYELTVGECLAMGFKNVVMAPSTNGSSSTDIVSDARNKEIEDRNQTEAASSLKTSEKRMIYEFYDIVPDENGEMRSGSWYMIGDKAGPAMIARAWEWNNLPYQFDEFEPVRPPFVVGCAFPEPHQMYGKSFPWITESNQKEINAVANQEREAVAKALRPPVYVNKDGDVDLVALMNRRIGGVVQGNGPADSNVRELATMNPMAISPAHRARVDQDYAEAGIPPNLVGGESQNDTATEATQQLSNANKKIALILKNLAFTGILPAFNLLLRLEQTYETDEFIQMVTGRVLGWGLADDALPAREYIQGDFDLRVNLGLNKQAQVSKLFLLADRGTAANQAMVQMLQLGLVPPEAARFANTSKPWEEAAKILGFKDIDNWLLPALPPPQQQAPVDVLGAPSMPKQLEDPGTAISQTAPEAPGAALSVL